MYDDDYYDKEAFDNLPEENSGHDPDSFNNKFDVIYAQQKNRINSEENNQLRPISKIKNRRLNSQSPTKDVNFSKIKSKINKYFMENHITKEAFTKGDSNLFLKINELKNLFTNVKLSLTHNEISELFDYNNNFLAEGYICINSFLSYFYFKETEDKSIIHEENKESINIISNDKVKEKVKDQFRTLNNEIKEIIASSFNNKRLLSAKGNNKEKDKDKANSKQKTLLTHFTNRNATNFPLLTDDKLTKDKRNTTISAKSNSKITRTRKEFNLVTVENIKNKLSQDIYYENYINNDILQRKNLYEKDCKLQIPRLNLCCKFLKLNQYYELDVRAI